jgi:hypothetical protein
MLQAPFGSTGPGWMAMSSPGLAWFPTPIGAGGQPFTASPISSGFGGADSSGGPGTSMPITGYAHSGGSTPLGNSTLGWTGLGAGLPMIHMPLSTPFAVPDGITASALLAMIGLRRGQPQGPASDQDVEEFIYDAVELLPSAGEVEVRCEGGRVTLTGSVPHKRLKRDVGEIAWAIPGINDVQNTVGISAKRRARAFTRETEAPPSGQGRKQS